MQQFSIILVWALAFSGGCDALFAPVPNPNNCNNVPEICTTDSSQLLVCDPDSGRCKRADGKCATIAQCTSPTAPVCLNQSCVSCAQDEDCGAWSTLWSRDVRYCVGLTCQECGQHAHCTRNPLKPACDSTSHTCRPCQSGDECTSLVCRTDSTLAPDSGVQVGQCVPESAIAYVDNRVAGKCAVDAALPDAGTSTRPFCEIAGAVAAGRSAIRVLGSDKAYAPFTVNGKTTIVIGPGRDAQPPAVIAGVTVQEDGVQHVPGNLSLVGVQLGSATGNPPAPTTGNGAECLSNASLTLRSIVIRSAGRGVNTSSGCSALTVEQTFIKAAGYGIAVGLVGGGRPDIVWSTMWFGTLADSAGASFMGWRWAAAAVDTSRLIP